jgi:hypothetical protein
VEDEEQRDAVARGAHQHDGCQAATGHEDEHRRGDHDDTDHRLTGVVPQANRREGSARHRGEPGQGHEHQEYAGEVDRQRPALGHGGRLHRPAVDPAQGTGEAALAVDERRHARLHPGDERALREEREPDRHGHERQHEGHRDAVPQRERLRLSTDGELGGIRHEPRGLEGREEA